MVYGCFMDQGAKTEKICSLGDNIGNIGNMDRTEEISDLGDTGGMTIQV